MSVAAEVFSWLCAAVGAVMLFAGMLWALGWAVVKALRLLQTWNTLLLCVAVQVHGKEYRDELFWRAIRERADKSKFAAQTIANFALRRHPDDEFDADDNPKPANRECE